MATELPIENSHLSAFEGLKNEQNGFAFWWASELSLLLGYKDTKTFQNVIDRATKSFVSLGIPHYDNIQHELRDIDGILSHDFKLTRFACYITVMNGNPSKPEVAQAQAYFAHQTRKFELQQSSNELERLQIRDELTEGQKSLASIAKKAGVTNFPGFHDAGYRGLYNMSSWQLNQIGDWIKKQIWLIIWEEQNWPLIFFG